MRDRHKFYYYRPSGLPGEAVAYIRGDHPGYPLDQGGLIKEWIAPHFEVGGFDESKGKRTPGGRLTDFLNNDVGFLIVERKVRDLLASAGIGPESVQWLDVCIHRNGQEQAGEYFAANLLDVRSAVHPVKSKFVGPRRSVTKIVLRRDAIRGADIFRLSERLGQVFFSPRLKCLLGDAGVTGVEWAAVEVAD